MGSVVVDLLAGLAGRSVALVGCAASAAGTGLGPDVDGRDVVVRVNFGCPVPAAMVPDVGCRTDVLYHVLRHGRRELDATDVRAWRDAGVGVVVAVQPAEHPRTARMGVLMDAAGQPWTHTGRLRTDLAALLRTTPNTGVVAVVHLLSSALSRLDVYGFDFYASGHWVGQGGETARQAAAQVGGAAGHNQRRHRAYLTRLARTDLRLHLPATS